MSNPALDRQIQQALRELALARDEARPIKTRINDSHNPDHYLSEEDARKLLAPDEKFTELYNLLREEYPGLPVE